MENYSVTVRNCNKELSAKEKVRIKDISDAFKLDDVITPEGSIDIYPVTFATLAIHNEMSENKDYETLLIIDSKGDKYVTSSQSFRTSFFAIADEMQEAGEEDWGVKIYKLESKNYKGRYFITCSLI